MPATCRRRNSDQFLEKSDDIHSMNIVTFGRRFEKPRKDARFRIKTHGQPVSERGASAGSKGSGAAMRIFYRRTRANVLPWHDSISGQHAKRTVKQAINLQFA